MTKFNDDSEFLYTKVQILNIAAIIFRNFGHARDAEQKDLELFANAVFGLLFLRFYLGTL